MTTTSVILIVIAVVVGVMLLGRILSFLFRLLLIVAVLGFAYYWLTGNNPVENVNLPHTSLFENRTLNELKRDYCAGSADAEAGIRCECLVQPLESDMNKRFTNAQLNEMENNRLRMKAELVRSFNNQSAVIKACFTRKKDEKLSFYYRLRDFFGGDQSTSQ